MRAESIACRVWIATPVMGSRVRKSTWTTAPSAENSLNERRINSGIIFTVTRIVRFRVEDKTPAFESNYGLRFRVNRSLSLLWSVACALRKRAHTITHSLLKTFWWRHCIGSTWSRQTTGVPERVLSSGHNSGVSSTFRKNVEESASNRDSTTLQLFPSPSNCPKVCSGVIDRYHPPSVKPPLPTGNSEEPIFCYPTATLFQMHLLSLEKNEPKTKSRWCDKPSGTHRFFAAPRMLDQALHGSATSDR